MAAFAAVAAVSVAAVPAAAQQGSQSFPDVASDAYYAQAVEALGSRGVFEGTECAEGFCPHQPLPRWQMAVWLVRALEEAESQATVSRFADVESDLWWMPYAERLAELEITVGCRSEPLSYCPDRPVSRAQMASFLARAFDLPAAEPAGFADVDSQTNVHGQNIDRLAASEITVGCRTEPLSYCPSRSVTRAQMAAFIYRGLKWQAAQTQDDDQTQEQPEFVTEENDVSRWIKRGLIDEYGDKWPWLKEVWDYANRQDFKYLIGSYPSAGIGGLRPAPTGDVFNLAVGRGLTLVAYNIDNPSSFATLVHELAHIYTLSHGRLQTLNRWLLPIFILISSPRMFACLGSFMLKLPNLWRRILILVRFLLIGILVTTYPVHRQLKLSLSYAKLSLARCQTGSMKLFRTLTTVWITQNFGQL